MKFKRRHEYGSHRVDETWLVHDIVEDSYSYHSGELENLRERVKALTEVLGYVVSLLPPDQVRQIAVHFVYEEDRT